MKKIISMLLLLNIFCVCLSGCNLKIETDEKNSDMVVATPDWSLVLEDGKLYGTGMYKPGSENNLILEDVAEFQFQDNYHDHPGDDSSQMLYVRQHDGSFWMQGHMWFSKAEQKYIKHNYKKLTKAMDGVKSFYKKIDEAVYVIKEDDSLWFWNKDGITKNGKTYYDFFKVMDNVKSVSTGMFIDYAIGLDDNLYAIDATDTKHAHAYYSKKHSRLKFFYNQDLQKVFSDVKKCWVLSSWFHPSFEVFVVDKNDVLWTWWSDGKKAGEIKRLGENVVDMIHYKDTDAWRSDVYFKKKDDSLWLFDEDLIKIADEVEKIAVTDRYSDKRKSWEGNSLDTEDDKLWILKKNGELWRYDFIKSKKELLSDNVKDFCHSYSGNYILKKDNTLVSQNGKLIMNGVETTHSTAMFGYDIALVETRDAVYSIENKKIKPLVSFD